MSIVMEYLKIEVKKLEKKLSRSFAKVLSCLNSRGLILGDEITESQIKKLIQCPLIKEKLAHGFKDFESACERYLNDNECLKSLHSIDDQESSKKSYQSNFLKDFLDLKSSTGFCSRVKPGQGINLAILEIQQLIVKGKILHAENSPFTPEKIVEALKNFKTFDGQELTDKECSKLQQSLQKIAQIAEQINKVVQQSVNRHSLLAPLNEPISKNGNASERLMVKPEPANIKNIHALHKQANFAKGRI